MLPSIIPIGVGSEGWSGDVIVDFRAFHTTPSKTLNINLYLHPNPTPAGGIWKHVLTLEIRTFHAIPSQNKIF